MERSDARRRVILLAAALCLLGVPSGFAATVLGGRLRLAGEVSGTLSPEDKGYFNYSDYQTSQLRLFRLDFAAEAVLAPVASVLVDVRSDNLDAPRIYALYLRLARRDGRLALQAGLVPPVFGAYPRRRYAYDNPLPSVPLVYQYLTTMRYDAVPQRAEDVVAQRGRGWLVRYPLGEEAPEPGLPVFNAQRWDAGVQLRLGSEPLSLSLAATQGSPSHPLVSDDNGGKQLSGRLQWRPGPALTLGVSGASGELLTSDLVALLPQEAQRGYRQDAAGVDLEWQAGYWIARAEVLWSRFALPALEATRIEAPLATLGGFAELRYKILPGLYAAARLERLGFASLDSSLGPKSWDAPVTRVEAGLGWAPRRHLLLKASWQHNQRDGGRVRRNDLVSLQALLWF